ncbi:putative bifunctional diguanylate cyclase/phosphodiesterase [Aestuariirhabdus litorea]|uniref:cyclic-guanylate-specific phosphodiesterase n=1 Tax=Aestuariirhabdus litorea TaxID=2528527 RepID=A0A3P3VQ06_9GAMM|nr:EAL domain-containing protein [Aestuariirhabdus litorea]RRJ82883.1 EAL domain-containing protein [Aestuariirhabdus litorea]RWW93042.1 EAL domain-containing protein [Endozoicomonadaceae bacterium GTF-13]
MSPHRDAGSPSLNLLLISTDQQRFLLLRQLLASHVDTTDCQLYWCPSVPGALAHLEGFDCDLLLVDESTSQEGVEALGSALNAMADPCPVVLLGEGGDSALTNSDRQVVDLLPDRALNAELLARVIHYSCELNRCRLQMDQQAQVDPLTNLPNRILFRDRLQRAIARADRDGSSFVLLVVDLDEFRKVNESFGQEAGDQLICKVTERLQASMRRTDTLARTSGDEFSIIMEHMPNSAEMLRAVKKLVDAIATPIEIGEHLVSAKCSVGISSYPEGGTDLAGLVHNAELAMKEAKKQLGSSYQFYTEEMKVEAMGQLYLEAELRRAIRLQELRLYYQPRIDVATERLVGVEALVRWQHPTRGLLSPAEFIPLAEESGLIVPIGYWVVYQACKDLGVLTAAGHSDLHVAVNLSFRQFRDERLQDTLIHILNEARVDMGRLEFELTETAVMQDPARVSGVMRSLNELGIQFSLDDFGSGYSSFSHLQQLPIQTLKIDRGFISDLQSNTDNQVIVRAMISLAHKLNLQVVAEGVDHLSQVGFLRGEACDQIQGFLYSQPIPLNALMTLLESDDHIRRLLNDPQVALESIGL